MFVLENMQTKGSSAGPILNEREARGMAGSLKPRRIYPHWVLPKLGNFILQVSAILQNNIERISSHCFHQSLG